MTQGKLGENGNERKGVREGENRMMWVTQLELWVMKKRKLRKKRRDRGEEGGHGRKSRHNGATR